MLSLVIPVYNEETGLKNNIEEIISYIPCDYEIVLVDDGSSDNTWKIIKELNDANKNIIGIRFSRNFGKESALMAGVSRASGDSVITMDVDLQHPPKYIPNLINKLNEGYDVVEAHKINRQKETLAYKVSAGLFYKTLKNLSGLDMVNSSDYKIMSRAVVDNIKNFKEGSLFFRGLVDWVGFNKTTIDVEVEERKSGKSKFNFKSLYRLALNAITSFSSSLLYITAILGVIFFAVAIILGVQTLVNKALGVAMAGFTTVILLQLIIGSMVMFCLAIIGIYVGKIYDETKRRPQYIISQTIGKD